MRPTGRPPRVMVLVGTRPEAIKMAPVLEALRGHAPLLEPRLVLTGQHTDLVHEALQEFGLTPDHDLAIMRPGQSLYEVAERCLRGLQALLDREPAEMILVQGDTASVFFGALTAFFERTRVGHVEAGLRSGNLASPFPEEGFRRLTGVLADLHFAPTVEAADNLRREGVPADRVHRTGNPVVDAVLRMAERDEPPVSAPLTRLIRRTRSAEGRFALLTAHRRESFGAPMERIFRAVRELLDSEPDLILLYPVHPNPRVAGPAREILGDHARVRLVDPLPYGDLVQALRWCSLVLTDSGGIQEEAPSFGVPLLVLREVTERPEGIRAGVAELVGSDRERIVGRARALLAEGDAGREARKRQNPYGDGHAGERIAEIVARSLEFAGSEEGE